MEKVYKYLTEHIEAIAALGFVIWMVSYSEGAVSEKGATNFTIPSLILVFSLYKSFYYVLYLKERIGLHYVNNRDFGKTVFAIALTLTSISLSFAVDYLLIDHFVQGSFCGYSGSTFLSKIFDFTYFSIMTMTTLGYAGVEPSGYWSKSIAAIQVLTSFSIIVFLIANLDEVRPFSEEEENIY